MTEWYKTNDKWHRKKKEEHLRRASWLDYQAPSVQLLTLVTLNRKPVLGELQGDSVCLSPLGEKVKKEIERIPDYPGSPSIELYSYVIMPDHVHILLQIHERLPKHMGQYVRWFKLKCSDALRELAGTAARTEPESENTNHTPVSGHVLGAVPPSEKMSLFASEYHDRILLGKAQLAHMKKYIKDNPRRLALKRANPDLFRIRRQSTINNIPCSTLGNIFLSNYPERVLLQCSRRLTQAEIDTKKAQCLAMAANGAIFVTCAISEGEKQITRTLREAGFPLIILLENGFPPEDSPHARYFKPQGVYFEACAAGQLLFVEPAKETIERPEIIAKVYAKIGDIPHTTQRFHFIAMNAIAEALCENNES